MKNCVKELVSMFSKETGKKHFPTFPGNDSKKVKTKNAFVTIKKSFNLKMYVCR